METNLFNDFDMLEQVPTDLMTDITEKPVSGLNEATKHTEIKETFTPGNPNPFPENKTSPEIKSQRLNAGSLITGEMCVNFIDMVIPVACILIIERVKGIKVNKRSLQATAEEKKIIAPVLENYLNTINFNVDNPLNALVIVLGFIYGTKTIEVLNMPVNETGQNNRVKPVSGLSGKTNLDGTPKKDGRGRPRKN